MYKRQYTSPYRRSPYRRSPYRRSPYRRSPYRRYSGGAAAAERERERERDRVRERRRVAEREREYAREREQGLQRGHYERERDQERERRGALAATAWARPEEAWALAEWERKQPKAKKSTDTGLGEHSLGPTHMDSLGRIFSIGEEHPHHPRTTALTAGLVQPGRIEEEQVPEPEEVAEEVPYIYRFYDEQLDLDIDLETLLTLRISSSESRTYVDGILRRMYTRIYGEDSSSKRISEVIGKLKKALCPPFRQVKSIFHCGDFGVPDDDSTITLRVKANWANFVFSQEDRKRAAHYVMSEDILGTRYFEEFDNLVDEDVKTWFETNWFLEFERKDKIYNLLLEKAPSLFEKIEMLYDWLKDRHDFIELLDITESEDDFIGMIEDLEEELDDELYIEYINKMVNELDHYRVGDYFYYYNYNYVTRQSYGIAMVGYNIEKKRKEVIFYGEGYPLDNAPRWLIEQFERIGLDYDHPEQDIEVFFSRYSY